MQMKMEIISSLHIHLRKCSLKNHILIIEKLFETIVVAQFTLLVEEVVSLIKYVTIDNLPICLNLLL